MERKGYPKLSVNRSEAAPLSVPGAEFHDAAADAALVKGLRELIDPERVEIHEVECDINDPELAVAMAERLHALVAG